jgi:GT2 family glycosyltransferase
MASLLLSLRALKSSFALAPVAISLIDNSEHHRLKLDLFDACANELEALGAELRLIQGHGNVGYGRAHNLAISKSAVDYHLILNPDVVLAEDCLRVGIDYLQNNPDTVLASPYAEDEQGQKQYLCKSYPSVFTFFVRGFVPAALQRLFSKRLARFEMHALSATVASAGVPIVSGCFMLCRTDKLRAVDGFDEGYFLYFEDFDLSLRLGKLGQIVYLPAMIIQHRGGHSARKGLHHIKLFVQSGRRFFASHGWRFFKQE